jgi:UDPglucose--hexose-1-phosphate uridylyltransferase
MSQAGPRRSEAPPALVFDRRRRRGSYLVADPSGKVGEVPFAVELRRDPLTGRSGRVAHFQGFRLLRPDLSAAIAASRLNCPFCEERVELVTPQLPEHPGRGARILVGDAVLFPNLSPYDRHSFVDVLTREHYLPPEEFLPHHLADGLRAAQQYFSELKPNRRGTFFLVTWNYMPPAGATQVHPHLQGFATDRPGNLLEDEVRCSRAFHQRHGRSYWDLLVTEEERLQERFLARGEHSAWLTAFWSRSVLSDVLAVFQNCRSLLELTSEGLLEFARGLCACLTFLSAEGVAAFNLALYSAPTGERRDHFRLHARLSPRIYFNPAILGSDTTAWHQLLDEPFMVRSPEALAAGLSPPVQAAIALHR